MHTRACQVLQVTFQAAALEAAGLSARACLAKLLRKRALEAVLSIRLRKWRIWLAAALPSASLLTPTVGMICAQQQALVSPVLLQ